MGTLYKKDEKHYPFHAIEQLEENQFVRHQIDIYTKKRIVLEYIFPLLCNSFYTNGLYETIIPIKDRNYIVV